MERREGGAEFIHADCRDPESYGKAGAHSAPINLPSSYCGSNQDKLSASFASFHRVLCAEIADTERD